MREPVIRQTAVLLVVLAIFMAVAIPSAFAEKDRPNLLFIFLDDFGWKDTGYMGSDFYETPHLDRLAGQALVFTDAYSCAANCAPARASLMSGQYTPRHQIYNVGTKPRGNAKHRKLEHIAGVQTLDTTIRTWAHCLQDAGYTTATMGKWHLSDDPLPYGFDLNIGGTHSGGPPQGYYPPHGNAPGLKDSPSNEYVTDRLSNEAVQFIRKHHDKSWALYLTHFAVHTPLHAKRELVAKYQAKTPGTLHNHVAMATMIQAVDDGVGQIQKTLEELQLADNTIIIFYSDNGGYGPATDMAPLKGYKGTYYEGGIRVPLFVKWPGVISPGKTSEPVIGVDFYPTILEMTGAGGPKDQTLDGKSLLPLLKGEVESLGARPLFWHFPAYLQSYQVISEQRDPLFRSRPCSIIRFGDWKLHQYFEDGGIELYNLRQDIGESQNVAMQNIDLVTSLVAKLDQWRAETKAHVPQVANPAYDAADEARAIQQIQNERRRRAREAQSNGC